jgi:hypothetical protein
MGVKLKSLTLRKEHRLRVFKNSALRRIFGPESVEVTGEWRKLHNGELHNLYSSPNIIRQIKSRILRWLGMLHAWKRTEKCTGFWWESPEEREQTEDRGVNGRMGPKWDIGWREWSVHLAQDRD